MESLGKVLVVNSDSMGRGDNELGVRLIGSFLRKLWVQEKKPTAIVFYNSGVKLVARGSAVLDALEGLSALGVDLVACGTCVTSFGLNDCIGAGRVSDMVEIADLLLRADTVITI